MGTAGTATFREPWNKGKILGQKATFKLKDIYALRVRLQIDLGDGGQSEELEVVNHIDPPGVCFAG